MKMVKINKMSNIALKIGQKQMNKNNENKLLNRLIINEIRKLSPMKKPI